MRLKAEMIVQRFSKKRIYIFGKSDRTNQWVVKHVLPDEGGVADGTIRAGREGLMGGGVVDPQPWAQYIDSDISKLKSSATQRM